MTRKSSGFSLSPDATKVLYTASASGELKEGLLPSIPGSSTQPQNRSIEAGKTYVYDLKEDRNFLVFNGAATTGHQVPKPTLEAKLSDIISLKAPRAYWFPTSNHLVLAEEAKVTISDYDGTNAQVVWSGSYVAPFALPMPNASRILILTSLGAGGLNSFNLYGLGLR